MRVGGSAPVPFEARLVAASNKDLIAEVDKGTFREDLYYRLNVVSIEVPPLREREGDVRLLAEHFLRHFASYYAKGPMSFTPEALAALERARWEGNVRELRNLVESLVVLSRAGTVDVMHLPPTYRETRPQEPSSQRETEGTPFAADAPGKPGVSTSDPTDGSRTMRDIERDAILTALRESGGNRDRAARLLGIGLRTLQRKIKEYRAQGIDV